MMYCAYALWLAVGFAVCAGAAAYTVDCNHEYTDCDNELSRITADDEDTVVAAESLPVPVIVAQTGTTTPPSTSTTFTAPTVTVEKKIIETTTELPTTVDLAAKPRPRLLNLSVDDLQNFANALHNQTQKEEKKDMIDLSDVNLDGDDDDEAVRMTHIQGKHDKTIPDKFYSNLQAPFHPLLTAIDKSEEQDASCKENEITYKIGDRYDRGCEESCECMPGGIFHCSPRCKHPYIRRGRRLNDPLCFESPVDDCCSIVACATGNGEVKATAIEVCRYGNGTYPVGSIWHIDCEQTCTCKANSVVTCKPRCKRPPQSDKCINVQDPNDECCEVQVCDVSQDVHEEPNENITSITTVNTTNTNNGSRVNSASSSGEMPITTSSMRPLVLLEPIGSVKVLQNNSVQVNLIHMNDSSDPIHLLLSSDGGQTFKDVELKYTNLILNLEGGRNYILKTKETGTRFNFTITSIDTGANELPAVEELEPVKSDRVGCHHDGKFYEIGEEFHIGCSELCECMGPDIKECAELVCPSHVGLELVSKGCVRWAPNPPPHPPNCCPRAARCLSDGTCYYKGTPVPNWSEVPISLTGCEQRCFCENGELDCQEICTPLQPVPPQTLRCPPLHRPAPINISDEDCCKQWGCVPNAQTPNPRPQQPFLPTMPPEVNYSQDDIPDYDLHRPVNALDPNLPGFPTGLHIPGNSEANKKLTVISLQSDSPTSVKMLFGLPPILVGLRGSVDLRYTDKADEDISTWYSQVFAPADEILTTPRLEFRLTGLKPSTMYKIRAKLYLHNLPVEPESNIYTVKTEDLENVRSEEKRREVDSRLTVVDVNVTTAHVSWRHFNEEELQLIDGIQVRFRPVGTPIYSMTELLHHSRSVAELHELRPGTRYEASLVLVPPPKAVTELYDPGMVEFTTSPFNDPYNWTVAIEARAVGSEAAEITWRGVPSPAERWVRVYRAAHACGNSGRREHDAFRLAARDVAPSITLTGLEPGQRCRVWLEVFLTNGKVKTSNVLEIHTMTVESDIDNKIEASSVAGSRSTPRGDYYGALVVVGVVAALGALTSLLLLLIVVKRHRPRSVPITPVPSAPRESSLPPYDNPAYKLELQQETMDL